MQCRASKASYLKVAVAAFATDPRIAAFRARVASAMGQTHRRIDLIDADRLLLEVVSSRVRVMRLM